MSYVHVKCLQRWRNTSTSRSAFFSCPQCKYQYRFARTQIVGIATNPGILHSLRVYYRSLMPQSCRRRHLRHPLHAPCSALVLRHHLLHVVVRRTLRHFLLSYRLLLQFLVFSRRCCAGPHPRCPPCPPGSRRQRRPNLWAGRRPVRVRTSFGTRFPPVLHSPLLTRPPHDWCWLPRANAPLATIHQSRTIPCPLPL
ncbi:hypothetical protein B0H16DRAFT_23822 [Mycena metata]|uniref:RING-CH-type domain-containing protein n=1 Tax=Mycena metata TaxID=1033252 RepID=A0AAD7KI48_9AGAR|nr:hypothetical protein B0H16DRAFT_23822 [Mycena metata]